MSQFERDTLKRQIRQLGDVIAAIVGRARTAGSYETGLEAIRAAAANGLGIDYGALSRLIPESAALLLRDPEAIRAYAWICGEEADLLERAGHEAVAATRRRRAIELHFQAARRDRALADACRAAALELARHVDPAMLGDACRAWLESRPT